ncbi:4-hydroxy-3-methylbut-2-enyl diphosphate reductase [Prosthecobacter sp. SYSU 5D2]|uniref:4-hydroxy-3-methylbut-2-enyl diphosphate reductase n=1 Tax=Prosthecobacter sp. SYSU 5D2 TaxID=3134134 RepID=UPI0031FF37B4
MTIHLAQHYGMCFGVRDALRATHNASTQEPVTILGQLVHNPVVDAHLTTLGVRRGELDLLESATTQRVVITAHGASDVHRQRWQEAGHQITDTSCPLVKKAHQALATLVEEGYHPVVIGQRTHVEVRGLIGDYPQASVLLTAEDACCIPGYSKLGVISQTTQPLEQVLRIVDAIKHRHRNSEVRFVDTVCRPTKQRQTALEELTRLCDFIVVIGGRNSNNTRQLAEKARALGVKVQQVETAEDLRPDWFRGVNHVGVTAGTSTLDETVRSVMDRLQFLSKQ